MDRVARDLRSLLAALEVPGPLVLVGHSGGGLIARTFRELHPHLVGGLVLVDASHEDQLAHIQGARRELARMRRALTLRALIAPTGLLALRARLLGRMLTSTARRRLPADALRAFLRMEARRSFALAARRELDAIEESMERLRRRDLALPAIPTIVMTGGRDRPAEWLQLQTGLAGLFPRSRHRILPAVGHDIPLEAPEEVVGAIRDVVAMIAGPVKPE